MLQTVGLCTLTFRDRHLSQASALAGLLSTADVCRGLFLGGCDISLTPDCVNQIECTLDSYERSDVTIPRQLNYITASLTIKSYNQVTICDVLKACKLVSPDPVIPRRDAVIRGRVRGSCAPPARLMLVGPRAKLKSRGARYPRLRCDWLGMFPRIQTPESAPKTETPKTLAPGVTSWEKRYMKQPLVTRTLRFALLLVILSNIFSHTYLAILPSSKWQTPSTPSLIPSMMRVLGRRNPVSSCQRHRLMIIPLRMNSSSRRLGVSFVSWTLR